MEVINYLHNRIPQLRAERLFSIGRYDEMRSYFLSTAEIFLSMRGKEIFVGDLEFTSLQEHCEDGNRRRIVLHVSYIRKVDKGIWIFVLWMS